MSNSGYQRQREAGEKREGYYIDDITTIKAAIVIESSKVRRSSRCKVFEPIMLLTLITMDSSFSFN